MFKRIFARREQIFLLLILVLTAFLTFFKVWDDVYGNAYYTAAVKSMLTSWHNFFFVSLDRAGLTSVDKPPIGLWLQCLFGLIFGVHGWSVILPEALCAVGSVAVLYVLVKRYQGEYCALLAALFLALTPMIVAVSRTNNLDAPLILTCLLALWALLKAAEKGSLRHIVLSMAILGIGFNIKMMQAYLFLPAIYLVYFFTAKTKWSKRVLHLAIATVVLVAVSLSWSIAVDLTPASDRPFVGSSTANSELNLALGYNGILRALPIKSAELQALSGAVDQMPCDCGKAGLLRLFNYELAGQIAWLLPLSVFGILALAMKLYKKDKTERTSALRLLLMWGVSFAVLAAIFSVSIHIHRYYVSMLAPCAAALAAIAVSEFWRRFKSRLFYLLPLSLAITASVQVYILIMYRAGAPKILLPVFITVASAAVIMLVAVRLLKKDGTALKTVAAALAVAGLLTAPLYWSYTPIQYGVYTILPFAGPPSVSRPRSNGVEAEVTSVYDKFQHGGDILYDLFSKDFITYLQERDNGSRFLIACQDRTYFLTFLLHDIPVMPLGGYSAMDANITLDQFIELARRGELQYYYDRKNISGTPFTTITDWVRQNGRLVDYKDYSKFRYSFDLYDLSGLKES